MNSGRNAKGSHGDSANPVTPNPSSASVIAIRVREPATRPATTSAAVTAPAPKTPMMAPASVSACPKVCANAGASVLIGSEANPTLITISRKSTSCGSRRSSAMLSRNDGDSSRSCSRGRMTSSAPASRRYEKALSRNAAGIPSQTIAPAALAGPSASDEQQLAPVDAVGDGARPRRQDEDRDELRKVEDAEQEHRVGEAEDEQGGREVLKPGSAGRRRVPEEVRTEVARPQHPRGCARTYVPPRRLHPGCLPSSTGSGRGGRRAERRPRKPFSGGRRGRNSSDL